MIDDPPACATAEFGRGFVTGIYMVSWIPIPPLRRKADDQPPQRDGVGFLALFYCFLFLFATPAGATHNRGGEITFRQLSGLTFEITVVTYTKDQNAADRPELPVSFNYGNPVVIDTVPRLSRVFVGNDIVRNTYVTTHTFPGPSTYTVSVADPNRVANVVNIPNSVNLMFFIQTQLTISPFLGANSSPILNFPPIDYACINRLFVHNPGAVDPDGDSLSYEITPCRGDNGLPVPGFFYPAPQSQLYVDGIYGDFIWNTPQQLGEFNFAMLIREWRNGVNISSILRDFQVTVAPCNNRPPNLNLPPDTCVVAGSPLLRTITATDSDGQVISLSAAGMPFAPPRGAVSQSSATFTDVTGVGPLSSSFEWNTTCSHIRLSPYRVVFKAIDNGNPPLTAYGVWNIRVIPPAVTGPAASPLPASIRVNFDPHPCTSALGYRIYRKQGSGPFVPGYCVTGVPPSTGYVLIDTVMGRMSTVYVDDNGGRGLPQGEEYCYRITAFFSENPLNPLGGSESITSEEACARVPLSLPAFTRVSVRRTDAITGVVSLAWIGPAELDQSLFPPPYQLELSRSLRPDFQGSTSVFARTWPSFASLMADTAHLDSALNTTQGPHYYRLALYSGVSTALVGRNAPASSVYLQVQPLDSRLRLNWIWDTPWLNDSFYVYRGGTAGVWQLLGVTNQSEWVDSGLVNGLSYCYYVMSRGGYRAPGMPSLLFNDAQQVCGIPRDSVPPCPPTLAVATDCDRFQNALSWQQKPECAADLREWRIYFSEGAGAPFVLLTSVPADSLPAWVHSGLLSSVAGCYRITAVDSGGNESGFVNEVCADNCLRYELPNVFSPNGDGVNDVFRPLPGWRFVESVDLYVYNRWGQVVFRSIVPAIDWDGTSAQGTPVEEGTYYYRIRVNFRVFSGIESVDREGVVGLYR